MKRKALGKGLSALLPEPEPSTETLAEAPTDRLEPNPYQPRTVMRPEALAELAASIKESGILQPILVRRHGDRYQIVAGERRWRAAQALGLARVPIVVRDIPDERLLEVALVENIQRQELSALEEAQAYQRLQQEFQMSQEAVAERVGRDRSTVANTLRLLRLPREARDLLEAGRIEAGHARALLALPEAEHQNALAREVAARGLSVRQVEARVASQRDGAGKKSTARTADPNTRAAEERLRQALGTRVEIARRGKGGSLRITFTSEAELSRLFDALLSAGRGLPR
jgi:ParB family chromosome partitioning protein